KSDRIANDDAVIIIEFDKPLLSKLGEGATDRFRSEAEIFGHIASLHRHDERPDLEAMLAIRPGQHREETGEPFGRRELSYDRQMLPDALQLFLQKCRHCVSHIRVAMDKGIESRS